jgi:hypothetical protein
LNEDQMLSLSILLRRSPLCWIVRLSQIVHQIGRQVIETN